MKRALFLGMVVAAIMASCSNKTTHVYTVSDSTSQGGLGAPVKVKPTGGTPVSVAPDATAFRMSGDYAGNVAVTLSPEGEILYFPAPGDITADSSPISLGNGWWLNCQGFGPNTVFTKYTFAEYAELPEAPTVQQIKNSIIPGAKVLELKVIPMTLEEARLNPQQAFQYLR